MNTTLCVGDHCHQMFILLIAIVVFRNMKPVRFNCCYLVCTPRMCGAFPPADASVCSSGKEPVFRNCHVFIFGMGYVGVRFAEAMRKFSFSLIQCTCEHIAFPVILQITPGFIVGICLDLYRISFTLLRFITTLIRSYCVLYRLCGMTKDLRLQKEMVHLCPD